MAGYKTATKFVRDLCTARNTWIIWTKSVSRVHFITLNQSPRLEWELAELPPEERYTQHLERSKPVMDALLAWAETTNAAPKSALGKAVYYLKEQWPYLIRVLEDGRLALSNNLAERSIKPFVIGRKNFLFANTPWGAQGSAVIYSMIETAKESGLDPYRYLTWLLTNAPIMAARDDSWADKFLPANAPGRLPFFTTELLI